MITGSGDGPSTAPLRAVVFDMDGVLIDTEPVWRRVETEVFGSLGVTLTDADCRETMGVRIGEVVATRYQRSPWAGPSIDEVTARIVDGMVDHVHAAGEPMAGVVAAVDVVRRAGLLCAVASSSPPALITAVLDRLHIADAIDAVCSATDDARGKPAPDVYLRVAAELAVAPANCLAIEDSVNGVAAARAAGMLCIAVPDPVTATDSRLQLATIRLASLEELDDRCLDEVRRRYFA